MRFKTLLRWQLALVAILTVSFAICVPSLMAQSAGTSSLTGTITDPSGAAIPNVTVTITSNDTGQTRTWYHRIGRRLQVLAAATGQLQSSLCGIGIQDG